MWIKPEKKTWNQRKCVTKFKKKKKGAYLVYIPSQLHQQGDGLSHYDSVVDVAALQTRLQFGEVSEKRQSRLVIKNNMQFWYDYYYKPNWQPI